MTPDETYKSINEALSHLYDAALFINNVDIDAERAIGETQNSIFLAMSLLEGIVDPEP